MIFSNPDAFQMGSEVPLCQYDILAHFKLWRHASFNYISVRYFLVSGILLVERRHQIYHRLLLNFITQTSAPLIH